jgi:hypothetical protein
MFAALNSFQVGGKPTFVSEVFSTSLYTGNGATQTITNGIDLSNRGGLVWIKSRTNSAGTGRNSLWDTSRGRDNSLIITNAAQDTGIGAGAGVTSFNTNGFSLGTAYFETNVSSDSVVSWTFREQPKFFDIVIYTGNGTNNRAIAHALGSAPGCVIVKSTSNAANWPVYHRSTGANTIFWLNLTNANSANSNYFPTAPDSTSFYVGTDSDVNLNGYTYVAYLFAHDAGGFGLSGNDNVISCGSTNGSKVTLGYEPQWILYKSSDFSEFWQVVDNQRGMPAASPAQLLKPNTSDAETTTSNNITIESDGFTLGAVTGTVIYIAIKAS